MLTIEKLFNDSNIISAIIDRVNQMKLDTVYWKQYLDFRRTTTRVFKDYIGTVTGVQAGSINSRYGEKPIRERRNMGSGYGEIAYLGDRYQMSIDRLSELQDLIDKFNVAKTAEQNIALNEIINFIYDDFRQVLLAAHKRMDLVVGSLLMTGSATVKNKDNRVDPNTPDTLDIDLPFKFITPETSAKTKFVTYLLEQLNTLKVDYGTFQKMIMTRSTFVNSIVGSSEFGDKYKQVLESRQVYLSTGLMSSELASEIFRGVGLPPIEIKEDYVMDQTGKNQAVYADGRITLLPSDKVGWMRHHTPYESTDPIPDRTYTKVEGDMLISQSRDSNGRYLEYTAEWIPQISNPTKIVNFDLSVMNA